MFLLHSWNTYYCPISTILKAMALEQDHLATQKICMLVVGKEAGTFSTLHRMTNCVKNGTRKIVSSNRYQRLPRCSVTHTYFRSSLRILFTVFSETKTQLWKLMWAISAEAAPCIRPWWESGLLKRSPLKKVWIFYLPNSYYRSGRE